MVEQAERCLLATIGNIDKKAWEELEHQLVRYSSLDINLERLGPGGLYYDRYHADVIKGLQEFYRHVNTTHLVTKIDSKKSSSSRRKDGKTRSFNKVDFVMNVTVLRRTKRGELTADLHQATVRWEVTMEEKEDGDWVMKDLRFYDLPLCILPG